MHECGTGVAFGLEAVPSLGFFPCFLPLLPSFFFW